MALRYSLEYTPDFRRETIEIYNYIAKNLYSPEAARKKLERIAKSIQLLATAPKMHRVRKKNHDGEEIRAFPVEGYTVIYMVDDKKCVVNILHVIHGKRNIDEVI